MKPTVKNLAEFSKKSVSTIQRWKTSNPTLYKMIKKEFMELYVTKRNTKTNLHYI